MIVVSPTYAITDLFWSAWREWKAYKAERKQSYKPIGEQAAIKRLFRIFSSEQEAIDAMEYSMAQNYSGIFAESKPLTQTKPTIRQPSGYDPNAGPEPRKIS